MDGVQNTTAERKVDENTGADATDDAADVAADVVADNVGSAVTANDPDPNTDPLIYTLSGADGWSVQGQPGQYYYPECK